jgi:2-phosphoglycerate kinase
MRIRLGDLEIPYPLFTVKGRLRLSGLNDQAISEVVSEIARSNFETEEALLNHIQDTLESFKSEVQDNFQTITRYEKLRGKNHELPAIIVVLEGASATGKSLVALELIQDLTATRFISTDSVRMVLRGMLNQEKHPELFCHTYQAHEFRQAGPNELDPVLRGYLAQCEIIMPHIKKMTQGIIEEGANAVVEGVHIQPGSLKNLNPGVIEVLINPDATTHKAMFTGKYNLEKLRTVSEDTEVRKKEFDATRNIQDFMIATAEKTRIPIVPLTGYDEARISISSLIVSRVRNLLSSFEDGESET